MTTYQKFGLSGLATNGIHVDVLEALPHNVEIRINQNAQDRFVLVKPSRDSTIDSLSWKAVYRIPTLASAVDYASSAFTNNNQLTARGFDTTYVVDLDGEKTYRVTCSTS